MAPSLTPPLLLVQARRSIRQGFPESPATPHRSSPKVSLPKGQSPPQSPATATHRRFLPPHAPARITPPNEDARDFSDQNVNGVGGCSVGKSIRKCPRSLILNDQAVEDGISPSCGEGVFGMSQWVQASFGAKFLKQLVNGTAEVGFIRAAGKELSEALLQFGCVFQDEPGKFGVGRHCSDVVRLRPASNIAPDGKWRASVLPHHRGLLVAKQCAADGADAAVRYRAFSGFW